MIFTYQTPFVLNEQSIKSGENLTPRSSYSNGTSWLELAATLIA